MHMLSYNPSTAITIFAIRFHNDRHDSTSCWMRWCQAAAAHARSWAIARKPSATSSHPAGEADVRRWTALLQGEESWTGEGLDEVKEEQPAFPVQAGFGCVVVLVVAAHRCSSHWRFFPSDFECSLWTPLMCSSPVTNHPIVWVPQAWAILPPEKFSWTARANCERLAAKTDMYWTVWTRLLSFHAGPCSILFCCPQTTLSSPIPSESYDLEVCGYDLEVCGDSALCDGYLLFDLFNGLFLRTMSILFCESDRQRPQAQFVLQLLKVEYSSLMYLEQGCFSSLSYAVEFSASS